MVEGLVREDRPTISTARGDKCVIRGIAQGIQKLATTFHRGAREISVRLKMILKRDGKTQTLEFFLADATRSG